jgi:AcrR family transcriptional regulator
MPKPFSEHERQIIQEKFLEKGYEMFSAHGLKKVSVAELAQAVNISKGAFYQFYDPKEALFMDIVEEAEERYRLDLFRLIDQPGDSPHARLRVVLQHALSLWKEIPILQIFTSDDYDLLVRRMPIDRLQEHMTSDQAFIEQFIQRCRTAGISIQVSPEAFRNLLYALLLMVMHSDDFGEGQLDKTFDIVLGLITAYCMGEVASVPIPSE